MKIKAIGEFREKHADTLTLHCSDGRFTDAVREMMRIEKHPEYDIMALPGGAALLDISSASLVEVEAVRSGTSFLIKGHKIQNVYLIGHTNCGFYGKRYAGQPLDRIIERQERDLQAAAAWVQKTHPNVVVQAYMASPAEKHVEFNSVDLSVSNKFFFL